jgi:membrane protease YdiL (CAAX protease family)
VAESRATTGLGLDDRVELAAVAATLAVGGYAVGNVVVLVLAGLLEGAGIPVLDRPARLLVVSTFGLQGLGFGGVALVYLRRTGRGLAFVRASVPSLRDVAWIVVGFPLLFGVYLAVTNGLAAAGVPIGESDVINAVRGVPEVALALAALSILLVGPAEELLYRGIVQRTFGRAVGPVGAILATSAVFAAIHYPAVSGSVEARLAVVLVIFVSAVGLGSLYEWTGNLVVPALVHGLFNATQFVAVYVETAGVVIG